MYLLYEQTSDFFLNHDKSLRKSFFERFALFLFCNINTWFFVWWRHYFQTESIFLLPFIVVLKPIFLRCKNSNWIVNAIDSFFDVWVNFWLLWSISGSFLLSSEIKFKPEISYVQLSKLNNEYFECCSFKWNLLRLFVDSDEVIEEEYTDVLSKLEVSVV